MDVKLLALKEAQKIRQTPVKLVGKEGNISRESKVRLTGLMPS